MNIKLLYTAWLKVEAELLNLRYDSQNVRFLYQWASSISPTKYYSTSRYVVFFGPKSVLTLLHTNVV